MGGWEFGAGLFIGFILTLCVYLFLTTDRHEKPLKGFMGWLRDFFTFKKLYIEAVLRFLYILTTCIVFSTGFLQIFERGWRGLLLMIAGPIIVRVAYEILMLGILLVRNVMEINDSIQGREHTNPILVDPVAFNAALQKRADELSEAFEKKNEAAKPAEEAEAEEKEAEVPETEKAPETEETAEAHETEKTMEEAAEETEAAETTFTEEKAGEEKTEETK